MLLGEAYDEPAAHRSFLSDRALRVLTPTRDAREGALRMALSAQAPGPDDARPRIRTRAGGNRFAKPILK